MSWLSLHVSINGGSRYSHLYSMYLTTTTAVRFGLADSEQHSRPQSGSDPSMGPEASHTRPAQLLHL